MNDTGTHLKGGPPSLCDIVHLPLDFIDAIIEVSNMVIRKRLAGTHLKGLVPRIAEGWPPRRLFNKALLVLVCLNLVLVLGSCYTARWFESDNSIVKSRYWNVRARVYAKEDFDSTGAWGIQFRIFPKDSSYSKYVYNIDSVTVKIATTDTIFRLKVDSLWVAYFGDSSKRLEFRSEQFIFPHEKTIKLLISSTIKTYEKDSWLLIEESPILISGSSVVKRGNKIFPGN